MANQSELEEDVAVMLTEHGVDYEREFKFHPTRRWRSDFLIGNDIILEVEGGLYHPQSGHRSVSGILRDIEKYNELTVLGYRLLRISEKDLRGENKWLELLKTMLPGFAD
jgi:hypothetical protein